MSGRRKICFVCLQARGAFIPAAGGAIGGAERQVSYLAKWLARQGEFDVRVIVADSGQAEIEGVDGVALHRLKQPSRGSLHRGWSSGRELSRMLAESRADFYIQMAAGPEAAFIARAARRGGTKFVYMVASDMECRAENPWSRGIKGMLWKYGVRRADRIVAQYGSQVEGIEKVFGKQPVVIPSAYPFGPEPTGERAGAIWVGRCVAIKQPMLFVELARRLPEFAFTMIAAPVEREPETMARLKGGELPPNLELIEGVAPDKLEEYYEKRGVLVNTSEFEGLPNAFIEAADRGGAVVSLNADPDGRFRRQGIGICCQGSLEKMVDAVRGLLTDEEQRRGIAAAARRAYAAEHAIEIVGKQYAAMLREVRD